MQDLEEISLNEIMAHLIFWRKKKKMSTVELACIRLIQEVQKLQKEMQK